MFSFLKRWFSSKNTRELLRIQKVVDKINAYEDEFAKLTEDDLRNKTVEFKQRLKDKDTLDTLLPEAFALVREMSGRVLGMRHFDVQLIGGIILHEGNISEMRTGEGKTLMATLPVYLNALLEKGVYVVTVNDYLAQRDANWMGVLYKALGLTVGVIQSGQSFPQKREAYACDVIYGTNNEFGFDYLRDHMVFSKDDIVQRNLYYAVIDEVDSILIDEARTPLIISGAVVENTKLYKTIDKLVSSLEKQEVKVDVEKSIFIENKLTDEEAEDTGDFIIDEKNKSIELTERGHKQVEELLIKASLLEGGDTLYSPANLPLLHHINAALKARNIFVKDVDYIVRDNSVLIVDEHTGRAMPGRRWSEGLHQAVEAKEGLTIQKESQTLASITFQNYFRLYEKIAGMTGTADTEAFEFKHTYGLEVVIIPTNMPMVRIDHNDLMYPTVKEKYKAIIADIKQCVSEGRPVLVGAASVESSEHLSLELKKSKIAHNILNAKFHEKEAQIIAQAGKSGAVTLATNMAGRGTDIILGGNWEAEVNGLEDPSAEDIDKIKSAWQENHEKVIKSGGLQIIGTERHESRRIDNQLRGRAGRQGDPGSSRFYISLEDNLMRIFAPPALLNRIRSMWTEPDEPLESRMVTNMVEKAQRKVEAHHFEIRKNLLDYDDVANDQRQLIYKQRRELLESEEVRETVDELMVEVMQQLTIQYINPEAAIEEDDLKELQVELKEQFGFQGDAVLLEWYQKQESVTCEDIADFISTSIKKQYAEKIKEIGEQVKLLEKQFFLQILDQLWKEHLSSMDYLRQGIHLRAYAQKQPKQEYKREAFELFEQLIWNIKYELVRLLLKIQVEAAGAPIVEREESADEKLQSLNYVHEKFSDEEVVEREEAEEEEENEKEPKTPYTRKERKVGRNALCPCNSGKKYKHCCAKKDSENTEDAV